MSKYTFEPNAWARAMFNLRSAKYSDDGMTPLLEKVLGVDNYNEFVVAQDPMCGGKTEGEIRIVLNRSERDPDKLQFASIGKIKQQI